MKNITIVGSGNLATNLAIELKKKDFNIVEIYSKSQESAKELSNKIKSKYTTNLSNLKKTDLFIICVKDDAIKQVISEIKFKDTPIIHSSGVTGLDVFEGKKIYGVLYPIQTFKKDISISFKDIPICIESNDANFKDKLCDIANRISGSVYSINTDARRRIHLAAVFACNFSNHMITISEKILNEKNLDISLLDKLIDQNIENIRKYSAKASQTGPAKRNDKKTIEKHLKLLKDDNFKKIYLEISRNISKEHQ